MIVYNITMKVEPEIEAEWMRWQKEEHIPEILSTGLFTEHKFFRLLNQDESEGNTYVIQYFTSSIENYHRYLNEFAQQFRQKVTDKWKEKFIAFRTVMEVVQ